MIGPIGPIGSIGSIGSKAAIEWSRAIDEAHIVRRPMAPADLDGITHLLMEDWQSVLGSDDLAADLPLLSAARIKHGVVVHGRGDRQQLRAGSWPTTAPCSSPTPSSRKPSPAPAGCRLAGKA